MIRNGERLLLTTALAHRAARAATGLRSLEAGRGDLIALYLHNDLAFFEASQAADRIEAYPTPVNWHYAEAEARCLFEDSGARAIIVHADLINSIRGALPDGVPVLVVATPPELAAAYGIEQTAIPTGMLDWNAWLEAFEPDEIPPPPGMIIYTSGTTGHPKRVRRNPPNLEQAAVSSRMRSQVFGYHLAPPAEIVTVITGPMYHSAPNGRGTLAVQIVAGVILQPRFDAEELLALIERHRVTHLHMVPVMFSRLLQLADKVKRRYNLSSLRYVVHTAAPCPVAVKRAMLDCMGPIIHEYYGSTETGAVTFCTAQQWLDHPGTVGARTPDATMKVFDPGGHELPPGQLGEIVIRFPGMADFTDHCDNTKCQSADRSGLIETDIVGYLYPDGFLHLCDRSKDMIVSGGTIIYPAEIEAELLRMPGVADCPVFGIPDDEFGEAVAAAVQISAGFDLDEQQVSPWLDERMTSYKAPRRVDFHSELPREDSGKLFKRKLREASGADSTGRFDGLRSWRF